jgi:hypothetical protein
MELLILILFGAFILWLGSKILDKAGLPKEMTFFLLIPIINLIMIWVFAFKKWPNLKPDVKQDL